jgi:hypothetical protein
VSGGKISSPGVVLFYLAHEKTERITSRQYTPFLLRLLTRGLDGANKKSRPAALRQSDGFVKIYYALCCFR